MWPLSCKYDGLCPINIWMISWLFARKTDRPLFFRDSSPVTLRANAFPQCIICQCVVISTVQGEWYPPCDGRTNFRANELITYLNNLIGIYCFTVWWAITYCTTMRDLQRERLKHLMANAMLEIWKKETGSLSSVMIEGTICITSGSGKTVVVQVTVVHLWWH